MTYIEPNPLADIVQDPDEANLWMEIRDCASIDEKVCSDFALQ